MKLTMARPLEKGTKKKTMRNISYLEECYEWRNERESKIQQGGVGRKMPNGQHAVPRELYHHLGKKLEAIRSCWRPRRSSSIGYRAAAVDVMGRTFGKTSGRPRRAAGGWRTWWSLARRPPAGHGSRTEGTKIVPAVLIHPVKSQKNVD